MADEQLIKPRELPAVSVVYADDAIMVDDGVVVGKATPVQIVDAGAPVASEAEAIAGTDNTKRITPLNLKQVLDDTTAPAVTRAQAWAESPDTPDPAIPGSKSSKTWAIESGASAIRSADSADLSAALTAESPQSWADFARFLGYADGKVVWFNGVQFVRDRAANIAGLGPGAGWRPLDSWSYEHFGGKDGEDITVAFRALHASIDGHTLSLATNAEYLIDISTSHSFSRTFTLRANGGRFRTTGTVTDINWAFVFLVPVRGDDLHLVFHSLGESRVDQRGLWFRAGCFFDSITVIGEDTDGYGESHGNGNAVRIAPYSDTAPHVASWVGRIETKNWPYPIYIRQVRDSVFGFFDVEVFRRAVAIIDATNTYVNGGHIRGLSRISSGRAGENGILIEAAKDYGVDGLWISNVAVEDAGEHGFRIGGQSIARNVTHTGCKSTRHGSGNGPNQAPHPDDHDHGGCGFKVLGPTTRSSTFHEDIKYISCTAEDGVIDRPVDGSQFPRINYAGFQVGKVMGGVLSDCSVVPSSNPDVNIPGYQFSCVNGFEIIGSHDISLVNPVVRFPYSAGIMFYDAADTGTYWWEAIINCRVTGGGVWLPLDGYPGTGAVFARALNKTMRRITITGLTTYSKGHTLRADMEGNGAYVGCSMRATTWMDSGIDTTFGAGAVEWSVMLDGNFRGGVTSSPARAGSTFENFDGQKYTRNEGRWVRQAQTRVVTIPDDGVVSIPMATASIVNLTASQSYGQAFLKTTGVLIADRLAGSTDFAVMAQALTGTTGVDGNLTVGGAAGTLYIENRLGAARDITITIPGG